MCSPLPYNLQQAWSLKWIRDENSEWFYVGNQNLSKDKIEEIIKILNSQAKGVFFLPELITKVPTSSDKKFYRLCIKKEYYELLRKKCE